MLSSAGRNQSHCVPTLLAALAGVLLVCASATAQTLPGLWSSTLYRVELTVSGSAVTGTFSWLEDPEAPPGTISGQLQPDGRVFVADWTYTTGNAAVGREAVCAPERHDGGNRNTFADKFEKWLAHIPEVAETGIFKTALTLSVDGEVLIGYRWTEEAQPTQFALHRAVNGELVVLLEESDVTDDGRVTDSPAGGPPATSTPTAPQPVTPTSQPATPADSALTREACVSNLQGIALASLLYALDHGGKLPDANKWCEQLMDYLGDGQILRCPSAPEQECGYAMNAALSGVELEKLQAPADTVLFFDSHLGTLNAAGGREAVCAPGRHGGGNCYAFADGFAKWLAEIPDLNAEGL
jgi:cell division septation protein DedD